MSKFMEVDGMRLLRLREERALSQRDLSARAGVAPDTIGQIEREERNAQPRTIRKLAEALGVEPIELMRRSDDA
jgi:transcriptional regulator with XRE-family HTH domain